MDRQPTATWMLTITCPYCEGPLAPTAIADGFTVGETRWNIRQLATCSTCDQPFELAVRLAPRSKRTVYRHRRHYPRDINAPAAQLIDELTGSRTEAPTTSCS